MTLEQALAEIRKGLGTQFDEKVGSSFINSDVYTLWDIIIQNGLQNNYHGPFAMFVAKNACGMTDKTQVEVGNIEDKSIKVSFEDTETIDKTEDTE